MYPTINVMFDPKNKEQAGDVEKFLQSSGVEITEKGEREFSFNLVPKPKPDLLDMRRFMKSFMGKAPNYKKES